jgi:hypothetical protein
MVTRLCNAIDHRCVAHLYSNSLFSAVSKLLATLSENLRVNKILLSVGVVTNRNFPRWSVRTPTIRFDIIVTNIEPRSGVVAKYLLPSNLYAASLYNRV